jgi:TatD DNase family protein
MSTKGRILMLIDAHSHLHHYPNTLLLTVLAQIKSLSIRTLAVAMDIPTYQKSRLLAERTPQIIPALGVHPWQAADNVRALKKMLPLLADVPVIGEIGLDFHWVTDTDTYLAQRKVLEFFLAAAHDFNKPVNLHTKGAEAEILDYLRQYGIQRALIHWYSGALATFEDYVEEGHYFSIGVEVLFSEQIRAFARALPLDQLLTETDNPGGLPWLCEQHPDARSPWHPHLINDHALPSAIVPVYEALAALKGISVHRLEEIVEANFERYLTGV